MALPLPVNIDSTYVDTGDSAANGIVAHQQAHDTLHTTANNSRYSLPDYTIYFDGTNYSARNERTSTIDSTSNSSIHVPFNFATKALNNNQQYDGAGSGFWDSYSAGGRVEIARPTSGAALSASAPLFVYTGQAIQGPGRGAVITAASNFTDSAVASETNGFGALLSVGWGVHLSDTALRVKLYDLALDCNSKSAGILFRRNQNGNVLAPGYSGTSEFVGNEVRNFNTYGIQVGIKNVDDASQAGSTNLWATRNFIHGGNAGSKAFATNTGDVHIEFNNINNDAKAGSFIIWINQLTTMIRNNHCAYQAGGIVNPSANIVYNSGSGHLCLGNYIDGAGDNGQAAVEVLGGGSVEMIANHVNWHSDTATFPAAKAAFTLAAGTSYCAVVGNVVLGKPTVNGAQLISLNAASAPTTQFVGNKGRYVNGFFAGTKPVCMSGNQINNIAGTVQSDTLITTAGLSATQATAQGVLEANCIQAFDGLQVMDTTNSRLWTRINGIWRFSQLT